MAVVLFPSASVPRAMERNRFNAVVKVLTFAEVEVVQR